MRFAVINVATQFSRIQPLMAETACWHVDGVTSYIRADLPCQSEASDWAVCRTGQDGTYVVNEFREL